VTALSAVPSVECTDSTSEESFGARTTIEAKKGDVDIAEMNQIVSHAVVMSFIYQHRHESQNSLVPAVGISCENSEFIAAFVTVPMMFSSTFNQPGGIIILIQIL